MLKNFGKFNFSGLKSAVFGASSSSSGASSNSFSSSNSPSFSGAGFSGFSFLPRLSPRLGLDLGTDRTRIWLQGQGVVVDQPSVLALNEKTGKVVAVGQDAAEMEGRVGTKNSDLQLHHPFVEAKIYDAETAQALLRVWLQKILGWRYLFSPVVMVSVAAASSQASRQAVTEVLHDLGAREVYTMAQPLAAAIGAGVPIADASGTLLCQLGAGVSEAALISLGSLVEFTSTNHAGAALDLKIQQTVQVQDQLKISLATARRLKEKMLLLNGSQQTTSVVGQRLADQRPQEVQLRAQDLSPAVTASASQIAELIESLLAATPPELTTDVLDKGILLSGGLAQLRGLTNYLTAKLGFSVAVIEKPKQAVIQGLGVALDHLSEFKQSLGYTG